MAGKESRSAVLGPQFDQQAIWAMFAQAAGLAASVPGYLFGPENTFKSHLAQQIRPNLKVH